MVLKNHYCASAVKGWVKASVKLKRLVWTQSFDVLSSPWGDGWDQVKRLFWLCSYIWNWSWCEEWNWFGSCLLIFNFLSFRISSVSYFLDDFRKRLVERDWLDTGVRGVRTAVCHCVYCALCVHWCAVLCVCVCHCVLCCVCHSTAYSCGGPWISWNTTPPTHDQLCPSDHHHHALHEFDKYDQGAGLVWELFVFLGVTSVLLMTQPHSILKDWSPSP